MSWIEPVQRGGVPHLEVGPTARVDQQGVAGEQPVAARGMKQERVMGVGMPRREQRVDFQGANAECLPFADADVPALQVVHRGAGDLAVGDRLELERPAHVVGVDVRLQGMGELQVHLVQDVKVAVRRLHHRVDQHGLAGLRAAEQIGVGERFPFEELSENHVRPFSAWTPPALL